MSRRFVVAIVMFLEAALVSRVLGQGVAGGYAPATSPASDGGSGGAAIVGYTLPLPPRDAHGWTIWPTPAITIYVGTSQGDDGNPGTSPDAPKKTIAAAFSALPGSGVSAAILLKCGETFSGGIPHMAFQAGGASREAPLLFGSYGSGARPIVKVPYSADGSGAIDLTGGGGVPYVGLSHIWYEDLDFYASFRDPSSPDYEATNAPAAPCGGLSSSISALTDIQLENCRFRFFNNGICIVVGKKQSASDIRIYRCEICDSWCGGDNPAHSQGLYIQDANQVLIDQNVIDHNGQNAKGDGGDPTIFNHDIYLSSQNAGVSNVSVTNNVVTNASNIGIHGAQFAKRMTGILVSGNLIAHCGNGIVPDGSNWQITGNVITEMGASPGGEAQSIDLNLGNGQNGIVVQGNYQIDSTALGGGSENLALTINKGVLTNCQWNHNTIRGRAFSSDADGEGMSNNAKASPGCVFTPNTVDAAPWAHSLAAYDAKIGGPGTSADFISRARNQSKSAWDGQYTAQAAVGFIVGQ